MIATFTSILATLCAFIVSAVVMIAGYGVILAEQVWVFVGLCYHAATPYVIQFQQWLSSINA